MIIISFPVFVPTLFPFSNCSTQASRLETYFSPLQWQLRISMKNHIAALRKIIKHHEIHIQITRFVAISSCTCVINTASLKNETGPWASRRLSTHWAPHAFRSLHQRNAASILTKDAQKYFPLSSVLPVKWTRTEVGLIPVIERKSIQASPKLYQQF